MPRWARFLSCTFTGLLVSFVGFIAAAYLYEGGSGFWSGLLDFLTLPAFRYSLLLFALLSGTGLIAARLIVHLYGLPDPLSGLLAGALTGAVYLAFLLAAHFADWGGAGALLTKLWPAGLIFLLPFALSGAFITWLWDRLD